VEPFVKETEMINLNKLKSEIAGLEISEGEVELSIAHLIQSVTVDKGFTKKFPAMLSVGAHRKKQRRFDAIGGAMALTEMGKQCLAEMHRGSDFKYDQEDMTWDARFTVPTAMYARAALKLLGDIEIGRRGFFETDPHREVFAELSGNELEGVSPTISRDHPGWHYVNYKYLGVSVQPLPDDGVGTSTSATKKMRRRLFHQWEMNVSGALFDLMNTSQAIVFLKGSELQSTNGGRQKGEMNDGTPKGDNLGVEVTVLA
jgi:hypothetical protein